MSRLLLRRPNPKLSAAGVKGGEATLKKHGLEHYQKMGQTPPREGSRPRGRPSIDYVIGNDGLLYTSREAIALAQESTSFNPGFSED